MISHFDNCIFIHIPKVAGQSIETVFLKRAGLTWEQREQMLLRKNAKKELGPPRLAHLFAKEYVELGYIAESQFQQMFKFAFVRNPWERLVSEYSYRNYQCSFKDFLLHNFPTSEQDNYETGFDGYRHIIPQYKFLYDDNGNLLVDFIGKYENLVADFAKVSKLITGKELTLPHKNKTKISKLWREKLFGKKKAKCYQEYYDDDTKAFVDKYYQQDIKLFNYKFE